MTETRIIAHWVTSEPWKKTLYKIVKNNNELKERRFIIVVYC